MIKYLHVLFFCSLSLVAFNQDNAKEVLETLCSEKFHGRGYVKKGDKKAAKYIAKQYKEIGLQTKDNSYYQYFDLDVNTFPKSTSFSIDGTTLKPGEDFIVNASSPKLKGNFVCQNVNVDSVEHKEYVEKLFAGLKENTIFKVVMPNTKNRDTIQTYHEVVYRLLPQIKPVLFFHNNKFTWSVGRRTNENAVFEVKSKFSNAKTASIKLDQKFIKNYTSQNVIGLLPSPTKNAKTIVICGHYDHLGRMGKNAYFPGANDNASGIAMILKLANHFKNNPVDKNIVFIAFGAEEAGLVGSTYFTNHPTFDLKEIDFVLNIDIMGSGDEGITMVNSKNQKEAFDKMTDINNEHQHIKTIKKRGQTKNSDHYPFSAKGVPAVFIYTQGNNSNYHDIYDTADHVNMKSFNSVFNLFKDFIVNHP